MGVIASEKYSNKALLRIDDLINTDEEKADSTEKISRGNEH